MDVVPVAIVPLPDTGTTGRQPAAPEGFPDLWAVLAELLSAEAGAEPLPPESVPALAAGAPAPEDVSGDPGPQEPGPKAVQPDPGGLALVLAVPTPAPVPGQPGLSSGEAAGAGAEPARPPPGSRAVDLPTLTKPEPDAEPDGRVQAPADPKAERLWGFWLRRARGAPPAAREGGKGPGGAVPRGADGVLPEAGESKADGPGPAPGPGAASPATSEAASRGEHARERAPGESGPKPVPAVAGAVEADPAAPTKSHAAQPNASRSPQPPPPVDQVSRAVRVAIRTGSDRMTVQLEPEHLGRVHVEVAREAGGLTAHIRVETPQAHQLLLNELPALRAAAETRQVPLVHVAVEFDRGDGRHGDRPDPRPRGRRRAGAESLEDEVAVRSAWMPWGFETRI